MAKRPDIETLLVGYNEKHKINKNFASIKEKFGEALSRSGADTPNFMKVDLDIADANITNVNRLDVQALTVVTDNFTGFSDLYIYKLAILDCDTEGDILTHDSSGDPICLPIGSEGQLLQAGSARPRWAADLDTDTIGVTVQEDGVTVAENVTTINFKWAGSTLVTTPAGNQVDLELEDLLTAIWEDTRSTSDLNIDPDGPSAVAFNGGAGEVVRLDLVNDVGIAIPGSDNLWYFIMEASSKLESNNNPDGGTWTQGVRFYDNTGTATPLTGNMINAPAGEVRYITDTTPGGALMTIYCGVPANTRYIDVAKGDAFLFPLFVTTATIDNRYRALVSAAVKESGFLTPNNVAYPGGVSASVTP